MRNGPGLDGGCWGDAKTGTCAWGSAIQPISLGQKLLYNGEHSMNRKLVFAFACAALGSTLASFSAQAEGGCGIGFHRGPMGCRPNGGAVVVAPVVVAPAVVAAPAVVVAPAVVCGPGSRWHPGFRRCVVL
jgi:hypothetical protein